MRDYRIIPVINSKGTKTRYIVRKGKKFLVSQTLYAEEIEWMTREELSEERFWDCKLFRSRRKAIRTAENLDRYEFRNRMARNLHDWNFIPD